MSAHVLVIVPAWNEQDALPGTIADIREVRPDVDLLVVDDGSSDRTAAVARAAGAEVCRLPFNLGVGGAMRAGYRYALARGYDVAVQIDADGQHDPRYLAALEAALRRPGGTGGADLVIGARFAGEGEPYRVSLARGLAMRVLARTLSRMARTRLTDVTSGFRVATRRALALFAAHYPAEYLGDTVESTVIAIRAGCEVAQVPVQMRSRQAGTASQTPVKAALYLARAVVALTLALVRRWPAVDLDDTPTALPGSRS
ncbi:glycosyltransferase family 2 protein [Nocardioides sp. R-C-SC26]|uniref:glycosyltransferase family 2 protein n=1 Tax=Nocardioides sp. R-C-SC26 TaxID=2870414 RepID=UPI001E3DFEAA|nr:glycosyltransferase family 2 protein [Nocardioides sp. R-C-SC26]